MDDHCQALLNQLFRYIDGELPEDEWRAVAEHLEVCERCEAERRIYVRIKELVSGCPHEEAPECLRTRVVDMIDRAKGAQ
jgi:mycothiol system anti-sigma-R factor